jgi:hypothetical protein
MISGLCEFPDDFSDKDPTWQQRCAATPTNAVRDTLSNLVPGF